MLTKRPYKCGNCPSYYDQGDGHFIGAAIQDRARVGQCRMRPPTGDRRPGIKPVAPGFLLGFLWGASDGTFDSAGTPAGADQRHLVVIESSSYGWLRIDASSRQRASRWPWPPSLNLPRSSRPQHRRYRGFTNGQEKDEAGFVVCSLSHLTLPFRKTFR
jgi:hypothetical protein